MSRLIPRIAFTSILASLSLLAAAAHAGPLDPPPGAVAPTGPTMILTPSFTITQSGSYRVARNLSSSNSVALTIDASDVTLDLGGFTITRSGGMPGNAIEIVGGRRNVVVRNGIIRYGGSSGGGIVAAGPQQVSRCRFEDLVIDINSPYAIDLPLGFNVSIRSCTILAAVRVGALCTAESCRIGGNAGPGLDAGERSVVRGCDIVSTTGGAALVVGERSIVVDTTLTRGASNGVAGIVLGDKSIATRCTVGGAAPTGAGIQAGVGCAIELCTIDSCTTGITVAGSSTVQGCVISGAITTGVAASGTRNRIAGNSLSLIGNVNGIAITAGSTGNVVSNNCISGSPSPAAAISGVAGNAVGQVIDLRDQAATFTNTDPTANFLH